jgi:hypothetical protein
MIITREDNRITYWSMLVRLWIYTLFTNNNQIKLSASNNYQINLEKTSEINRPALSRSGIFIKQENYIRINKIFTIQLWQEKLNMISLIADL